MASTTAADLIGGVLPLLEPVANAVMGMSHANPATAAKVGDALDVVKTGVVALAASETANQSKPIVDQIEAAGTAILAAAGPAAPFPWNIVAMAAGSMFTASIEAVRLLMAHKVTVPAAA
jgi:hypothetical protein